MTRPLSCFARSGLLLLLVISAAAAEKDKPARVDLYGDPLPAEAIARLGSVRDRLTEGINCLAYLPGSDLLAASSFGEGVVVLFSPEGKIVRRLAQEESGSRPGIAIAFSSDGKLLATTSGTDVVLRDVKANKLVRTIHCGFGAWHLRLSADGKRLAATGSRLHADGVRLVSEGALWNTDSGEELCRFHPGSSALAFSPARELITATGRTIVLRDARTGAERARIETEHPEILALVVSADGKTLASGGSDKSIVLWDVATRKLVRRLTSDDGNVYFLAFTPDSKALVSVRCFMVNALDYRKALMSGKSEGTCSVWDVASGRCRHRFTLTTREQPTSCTLSPDGKTLATSEGNIERWNLTANPGIVARPNPSFSYTIFSRAYNAITFAPDGKTIAIGGSPWSVWDAASGRMLRQWPTQPRAPLLGFSPKGKAILGTPCEAQESWDFRTGNRFHVPPDPSLDEWPVLTADGKRLSRVVRDEVVVRDAGSGKILRRVRVKGGNKSAEATLSPDGRLVAWAFRGYPSVPEEGDDLVTLCSAETGEILRTFGSKEKNILEAVTRLTFSVDGQWLAAFVPRYSIAVWETATGKERICTPRSEKSMFDLVFSPDGKLLAAACEDDRVRVWETVTGQEVHQFRGHLNRVFTVTFSPDGTRLLTSSADGTALIWDVAGRILPAKSSRADLERWWDELGGAAPRAFQARRHLTAAASQAVPFIGDRLQALAGSVPAKRLARLTNDLDSDEFAVRDSATRALSKLGHQAEPALRRLLANKPSLEVRRRVEEILAPLEGAALVPDQLRVVRALAVLEASQSATATKVLSQLAKGDTFAAMSQQAKEAIHRLTRLAACGLARGSDSP